MDDSFLSPPAPCPLPTQRLIIFLIGSPYSREVFTLLTRSLCPGCVLTSDISKPELGI